jgi:hypothetical protein
MSIPNVIASLVNKENGYGSGNGIAPQSTAH